MPEHTPVFTADDRDRLEAMTDYNSSTWDLSVNDHDSIAAALAEIDRLKAQRDDLLAACKAAVDWADGGWRKVDMYEIRDREAAIWGAIRAAVAKIAKAEGETTS